MDRQLLIIGTINFTFALLVAISYEIYSIPSNKVGSFPQGCEVAELIKHTLALIFNPDFVAD